MKKIYTIFIKSLKIPMFLGINEYEQKQLQDITVQIQVNYLKDIEILCYQSIINEILEKYSNSKISFAEDLAESISDLCLIKPNVKKVFVKVEKSANRIFTRSDSVGVEIIREN